MLHTIDLLKTLHPENEHQEILADAGNSMFEIFPNPASESFTIHLVSEQDDRVNIKLLSVEGIVVYSQPWQKVNRGFNDFNVATSGLPTGVYYVSVTMGDHKTNVEKLVIINN